MIENVYSKTGFVFKPEMLNDRHSKEITYDKKKSFSSVKNIFDTRDNTKLHLSPPNSHSNLRLLIKNKNPFVKEIKHNSIIKTVRSSKIGIKKIKENFKNSNIQSSRNANINSEV